jgi:predicted ATPase/DNA-binding CsgD family transcriptional regulator
METVQETFADGAVFIPLASIREPALVPPTVAQALEISEAPEHDPLVRVQTVLHSQHRLLVFDNAEHLLEAVAPLVAQLLATCPQVTVLVTSRVRLGLSDEQVVPLATLDQEASRALFASRAHAVVPAFAVTTENAPVIDAICTRLDRLPLAIELAAARTAVLPPPALLARLDRRLDLLTGGPRDAPERQRTMRAAIAWSHDLLTEPEQVLYRRLGVFVDGFTLEAVQAVMDDGTDVLAGVSALVAASLVIPAEVVGGEPRFAMLETIREHALEHLAASGEDEATRWRHARYLVALADQGWDAWDAMDGAVFAPWLHRLRAEIGNVRLALAWMLQHEPATAVQLAGALMDCWIAYLLRAEGRAWITRALQAAPDAPARYRARALLAAGWMALDQGDLESAEVVLTEAVTLARDMIDGEMLMISAEGFLGQVALDRGDLGRAQALLSEARTRAASSNPPRPLEVAIATMNLGRVFLVAGELSTAQDLLEEALAQHQSASAPVGVAFGQLYLGQLRLAQGHAARAVAHFQTALTGFVVTGYYSPVESILEGAARAVVRRQPVLATQLLGAAAVLRQQDGRVRDRLDDALYAQTREAAQTILGDAGFTAAWEAGKQLTWDEVLAEMDRLVAPLEKLDAPATHGLTPRELDVLRLVASGHSNRMIADALSISERTVENHVLHILAKLDLDSRTAAATWAVRNGLA